MVGHGAGVLLLAAVAGYWVLERADKHKGGLRKLGQILGGLIIVVSLVGLACRIWCLATMCKSPMMRGGYCPMMPSKGSAGP